MLSMRSRLHGVFDSVNMNRPRYLHQSRELHGHVRGRRDRQRALSSRNQIKLFVGQHIAVHIVRIGSEYAMRFSAVIASDFLTMPT
jgi:hypothetical protein